jgi:hypothetical protein
LPANWTQVPLSGGDIKGIVASLTKRDPTLKTFLSNEVNSAIKNGIKLFVVGPAENRFFPNVNVFVTSSKGQLTGQTFLDSTDAQVKITYAEAKYKNLKTSITILPLGQVLEVSYQLPTSISNGAHIDQIQIYVEHKTHIEIMTLTGTSLTEDQSLLKKIANSWLWK